MVDDMLTLCQTSFYYSGLRRKRQKRTMSQKEPNQYKPKNKIRFVTATSLFDGHDATINIMRRIIQSSGAEVIHLGHNRSAAEIVDTAIQEDAHAIAVTCYQGGHLEFFQYIYDLLQKRGAPWIKIFGGGGGVIVPEEMEQLKQEELESYILYSCYIATDMDFENNVYHAVKARYDLFNSVLDALTGTPIPASHPSEAVAVTQPEPTSV